MAQRKVRVWRDKDDPNAGRYRVGYDTYGFRFDEPNLVRVILRAVAVLPAERRRALIADMAAANELRVEDAPRLSAPQMNALELLSAAPGPGRTLAELHAAWPSTPQSPAATLNALRGILRRLEARGLAQRAPEWTITDAGRKALGATPEPIQP